MSFHRCSIFTRGQTVGPVTAGVHTVSSHLYAEKKGLRSMWRDSLSVVWVIWLHFLSVSWFIFVFSPRVQLMISAFISLHKHAAGREPATAPVHKSPLSMGLELVLWHFFHRKETWIVYQIGYSLSLVYNGSFRNSSCGSDNVWRLVIWCSFIFAWKYSCAVSFCFELNSNRNVRDKFNNFRPTFP
jgi:hypothetical protein